MTLFSAKKKKVSAKTPSNVCPSVQWVVLKALPPMTHIIAEQRQKDKEDKQWRYDAAEHLLTSLVCTDTV